MDRKTARKILRAHGVAIYVIAALLVALFVLAGYARSFGPGGSGSSLGLVLFTLLGALLSMPLFNIGRQLQFDDPAALRNGRAAFIGLAVIFGFMFLLTRMAGIGGAYAQLLPVMFLIALIGCFFLLNKDMAAALAKKGAKA